MIGLFKDLSPFAKPKPQIEKPRPDNVVFRLHYKVSRNYEKMYYFTIQILYYKTGVVNNSLGQTTGRPAVKISFVLLDFEKGGGRTDTTCLNSDHYRRSVGWPSGSKLIFWHSKLKIVTVHHSCSPGFVNLGIQLHLYWQRRFFHTMHVG